MSGRGHLPTNRRRLAGGRRESARVRQVIHNDDGKNSAEVEE